MPDRDEPWHDVPADSDVIAGTEEPDPAEVEGDEGDEVDVSRRDVPDVYAKYRRDTLDERLAEEVPDRIVGEPDPEAGDIIAAESDQDDVALELAEPDPDAEYDDSEADEGDDEAAEEAAVHLTDRP